MTRKQIHDIARQLRVEDAKVLYGLVFLKWPHHEGSFQSFDRLREQKLLQGWDPTPLGEQVAHAVKEILSNLNKTKEERVA